MLTILHGDNVVKSREALLSIKESYKDAEVIELPGSVDLTTLKQALESSSLFAQKRLVILENLFSARTKKTDDRMSYLLSGLYDADVVVWEGKKIDGRTLVSFKKTKIEEFKLDVVLFQFLENIRPGNQNVMLLLLSTLVERESIELIFFMVVRQIRLLLALTANASIPEVMRIAPWQRGKLQAQAKSFFHEETLVRLLHNLFSIEYAVKTGKTELTQRQELDILLGTL